MKFCSLQVRPESQYSTGHGPYWACGGKYTPTVMSQPSTSERCRYTFCPTPKLERLSMRSLVSSWLSLKSLSCDAGEGGAQSAPGSGPLLRQWSPHTHIMGTTHTERLRRDAA